LAQKSRKLLQKPPRKLSNYKKAVKLEEGLTVARQKASLRFKKSKKGLELSIREHIGKLIDKIDALEIAATIGLTFVIRGTILRDPGLLNLAASFFESEVYTTVFEHAGIAIQRYLGIPTVEVIEKRGFKFEDWHLWLISFALAYFLIKHGGALIGLLDKGLHSVVGMFLGA